MFYFSIKNSLKVSFVTSVKCVLNLIAIVVFFFMALIWTTFNVQNVSRRLCNLSFICYTVSNKNLIPIFKIFNLFNNLLKLFASSLLLVCYMITILLMAKLYTSVHAGPKLISDKDLSKDAVQEIVSMLKQTFSFAEINDSKFIGLLTFLISNLATGIVNLSMNTLHTSDPVALVIICGHCFISFAIPFAFYYSIHVRKDFSKSG